MICDINEFISQTDFKTRETDYNKWTELLSSKGLEEKFINKDQSFIIKYKKNILEKENYGTIGKLRSIVCQNESLLSFTPPKCLDFNEFVNKYPSHECFAEDYIEGTMITAYFNNKINKWEISSKSAIGATVYFYDKNLTFDKMFFEACKNCNFSIDSLPRNYCYTFVLQHPNNKIVLNITIPYLYLIKVYEIKNNMVFKVDLYNFITINNLLKKTENKLTIGIPNCYPIDSYENLYNYFGSYNTAMEYPGVMIYHKDGERSRIRNPVYEDIKYLRGNQPKLFYQYLELRKQNKVKDYLYYFPESIKFFSEYRDILHRFTVTLWKNYISCFIKKEQPLKDYNFQYKIHMYNLHNIYLENREPITKSLVIDYINNLDAAQILYAINYV